MSKSISIKKLSDLAPAPYNPRTISTKALKGLKNSLGEFGDLSGIVFNEQTGRRCVTSEIEPKYCDIILARWETLTGKEARKA